MRLSPGQLLLIIVALGLVGITPLAQAQAPKPQTPQSESTGPQDPRSTGAVGHSNESLSEKLDRTGGVIRPPAGITPDMSARPPVPDPGTTRVIPPPGAPGGDQTAEPK